MRIFEEGAGVKDPVFGELHRLRFGGKVSLEPIHKRFGVRFLAIERVSVWKRLDVLNSGGDRVFFVVNLDSRA